MADIYPKQYLMTAGPTPLPPAVSQVMAEPILYHRAPAFIEIYERVLGRLPEVFRTDNDVLCFASTGSGALESAVANLSRPGEPALVASCGKFGERWAELCEAFGADLEHVEFEWGEKVDPARVDEALGAMAVKPKVGLHDPVGDLDRGAQRHRGARRGCPRARCRALRRRGLGPRRRRAAAGRMGRGRRRIRLAEVADVPARAELRVRFPARPGPRCRRARRPLLLRLEPDGRRAAEVAAGFAVHDRGHAASGGSTSRSSRSSPRVSTTSSSVTRSSRGRREPGSPASAWSDSGPTIPMRTWSPRRACRRASTAPTSRRRCATATGSPRQGDRGI